MLARPAFGSEEVQREGRTPSTRPVVAWDVDCLCCDAGGEEEEIGRRAKERSGAGPLGLCSHGTAGHPASFLKLLPRDVLHQMPCCLYNLMITVLPLYCRSKGLGSRALAGHSTICR